MRLKEQLFYRNTGVRVKAQLMRPRLIPQRKLILPLKSIYHFNPSDTSTVGPSAQDPMLDRLEARIFIEHITELHTRDGNPRRTSVNPTMLRNDYRRKTRGIRPLRKDAALLINPRNTLVINYAMLGPLYRYIPSFKASYFRWYNVNETFWHSVVSTHERFGWNQYINLELPDVIPTYEQFKRFEKSFTQRSLEAFNTPQALNLMDFWLWLGDNRDKSGMRVLTQEMLDLTNFIISVKGYFFVINLGLLNKWRTDKEDEETISQGIEGSVLQRRFLKLLQGLRDLIGGVTQLEEEETQEEAGSPVLASQVTKEQPLPESSKVEPAPIMDDDRVYILPNPSDRIEEVDDAPLPPIVETPRNLPKTSETQSVPAEKESELLEDNEETLEDRLTTAIHSKAWELHETGVISARAYQRTIEESKTYLDLKDPYGSGQPLVEMLEVSQEDLVIEDEPILADRDTIPDKSMLSSKLKNMTRSYTDKVMRKDIVSSVMAIQQMGIAVKDYKIETERDAMNHYEVHRVTLKPVRGRQSTVSFRLPVVDKDGRFVSNGVKNALRLQRADIPIRKVNPSRVALTSYYNKTFVDRTERKVNNYERWLTNLITERATNPEDDSITNVRFSNVFDKSLDLPRIYSLLAKTFISFESGGIRYHFNYHTRGDNFGVDLKKIETGGMVLVGMSGNTPILVDGNNVFYRSTQSNLEVLGGIEELLDIDQQKAPIEIAEMSVSNKILPLGFTLGYHLGLSNLLEFLGCDVHRYTRGSRINLQPDEYSLTFQDEVLVLSRLDKRSSMIVAGLGRFHRALKEYSVWDFDRKDVYYKLLEDIGLGVRYLREIEALFTAWVDPITRGLLEDMGEPTDFQGLLIRSVELLISDHSPEEVDGAYMRYRGYERFAGMVYGELMRAAKTFNNRASTGEASVELNPHQVWQKIVQDPAVAPVKESNPIQDLRESEAMTYRGDGGRSGTSMVERTRIYYESDMGVVSESTVDSGDVGVVAYLSPDANFKNLRGVTKRFDKESDGPAKLLSTSALLAPGAAHDDPKRVNFIAIQQAQGIFADGYEPTPLRTGYEQVIAHRTTSLFATAAEHDGQVVEVTKRSIVVKYKNGEEVRVELGKRFGNAAGAYYPHEVVTDFKAGDKIKKGDIIAYNKKFFTPDVFNKNQVVWKAGVLCRTALMDNIETLEDGSAISEEMARRLNTQVTEIRTIEVRFDQIVRNLVKEGDSVGLDSMLCTIEDPEIAENSIFDDVSLDTLRRVSSMTPRAGVEGTISRVECFYHGDFEDLSTNLQEIVRASDNERRRQAKALGEPVFTGQVDTSFRVKGKALEPDTLAIRVYIDQDVAAGTGDKFVFGNQLKSIVSRVMTGVNRTESGEPIDAIFGNTSVEERIVHSPKLMGTTNTLLRVLSKHIVDVYRGNTDVKAKGQS